MITANSKPKRRVKVDVPIEGAPTSHDDPPLYLGPRKKSIYDSTCPNCNQPIGKGDAIAHAIIYRNGCQRKRWIHDGCTPATGAEVVATGGEVGVDEQARQQIEALQDALMKLAARNAELEKKIVDLDARTPRTIKVEVADKPAVEIKGVVHPAFEEVIGLAHQRKNIFLPGPTGCGKTHLARQIAEALGMGDKFSFISCSAGMSEGQVTGRLLPIEAGGKFAYVPSEFVERYEKGGVFLFDEIDAADANVLLVVNAALANGHLSLPHRCKKPVANRHADFICIAAANTFGTGADRVYAGRNQLDGATLDRFLIGTVEMDYDEAMERQLVGNDELYERLLAYRKRIREAKMRRSMSTRFMLDARDMVNAGWTFDRVDKAFFSGWSEADVRRVKGE